MVRSSFLGGVFAILVFDQAFAIENITNSSFNETPNITVTGWNSGWAQPPTQPAGYASTTGWNYVGTVAGAYSTASGVYLGGGWVITAAHVGVGDFALNGTTYPPVASSSRTIGAIDLILFRISPFPPLPPLILRTSDPVAYGSQVVTIGFGDGGPQTNETWGANTVTQINESIDLDSTWTSNDFLTLTGTSGSGKQSATNDYAVISGDSGGGAFIYNSSTKGWELAGINEVTGTVTYENGDTQNFSGFVQLDTYATQIGQIISPVVDTPTVPEWALILLGGLLFLVAGNSRRGDPRIQQVSESVGCR
jgi:hypothetical protein